jgi:hypothetical protein
MSDFEYLLALVSILVGLSIADLTLSLHRLLRSRKTVVWHWLPLASAALVLLLVLQFWWQFRMLEYVAEVWSYYAAFLVIAASLVGMFLLASAALPDRVDGQAFSLEDYYFENARYFWFLFVSFLLLSVVMQLMPVGFVFLSGGNVKPVLVLLGISGNLLAIVLFSSLAMVRNRTYHAVVVPLIFIFVIVHWSRLKLG